MNPFLIVVTLILCCLPAVLQASQAPATGEPSEPKVASEAASQVNPVHPTPQSLARAKAIYSYDCALCHDANGDGKGDFAVDQKLQLLDYRDPATLKGLTDSQVFAIIKDGKGKMPPEGDRAKPEELWNLVIYLRSFSKSPPVGKP